MLVRGGGGGDRPPAVVFEGRRVVPADVVRDDQPGGGGHGEVPDHPEAGQNTQGRSSPRAGLKLGIVLFQIVIK